MVARARWRAALASLRIGALFSVQQNAFLQQAARGDLPVTPESPQGERIFTGPPLWVESPLAFWRAPLMAVTNRPRYRHEPPVGRRTRRKFICFSTGNARRRRMSSSSARSLSLRKAARAARRLGVAVFFTPGRFQHLQHRLGTGPARRALAGNDVSEARHPQPVAT